ncbi:HGxxPAAW family protein [Streptomyces sp. NPDC058470]|uniref:HGxxPAAW family protein n=1 Tax=Streptomyces sp. NPDC058470 TaxID=3346515 RepID=UPI00366717DE
MSAHGDHDMGHTVAGWTGTALATVGSTILGVALATGSPVGLWSGGAVLILAALTTWLLHLAGWGKAGRPRPVGHHWRTRDTSARQGHPGCLGCRLAGRGAGGTAAATSTSTSTAQVEATPAKQTA